MPALGYKAFTIRQLEKASADSRQNKRHADRYHKQKRHLLDDSDGPHPSDKADGNIAATSWQKGGGWQGCQTSSRLAIEDTTLTVQLSSSPSRHVEVEMRLAQSCGEPGRCSGPYVLRSALTNAFWVSFCLANAMFPSSGF